MHYEFQSAIADGDIGRTMNIMSVSVVTLYALDKILTKMECMKVWTFTFTGSGEPNTQMSFSN